MLDSSTEFAEGVHLAECAATTSAELDRHTARLGAQRPFDPAGDVGGDEAYRAAHAAERDASQRFWTWVKANSSALTDHDLANVMRVLSGQGVI